MTTLDLTTSQPLPVARRKHKADGDEHTDVTTFMREVRKAAQLRKHETNPDVVAYRVLRTQRIVERIIYAVIVGGLAFTMVNVQQFAADGAEDWTLTWVAAWLLDPIVSLLLIAILIAGRALAKTGISLGPWARFAQWSLLFATYAMNTWQSWVALDVDQIVLHSIPPLVVFAAVEVLAELRERFTTAIDQAHAQAVEAAGERQKVATPPQAPLGQAEVNAARAAAGKPPVEATQPEEAKPAEGDRPTSKPSADDPAWIAYAAKVISELDAQHGREVGRGIVRPALGIGGPAAAELLAKVRNDDTPRLAAVR